MLGVTPMTIRTLWLRFWADLVALNRRNTGKRRVSKSKGNVKHRNYR